MSKLSTFLKLLKNNPHGIWHAMFANLQKNGLLDWLSDEKYLRLFYWCVFNNKLNLKNPQTFNEKLQWLKLYDRKPEYHQMVDKYEVKKYVGSMIGEEYIIPTYGVWDSVDDIEWDKLPEKFVLKTTCGSGGFDVVICNNLKTFDKDSAIKKLKTSLAKPDLFWFGREWPYKGNKNRIIAEAFLEDKKVSIPPDYKFLCCSGNLICTFTCTNRYQEGGLKVTFYNRDWCMLPFERNHPREDMPTEKPSNYEEMVNLAENLSTKIPFVRVDFYDVNGKIYFGELTFYPGSGFEQFQPDDWDSKLGRFITLPSTDGSLIVGGKLLIYNDILLNIEAVPFSNELKDYKIHCVNGRPVFILVCQDRYKNTGLTEDFFTERWDHLNIKRPAHPNATKAIAPPENLDLMLNLSRKLSSGIPFVRIDFYESNGCVKFGEMTFFPASGFEPFEPLEWDKKLGELIELPKI